MRVLIIEDDVSLRQNLVSTLLERGYAVDQAGDGEEGLHLLLEYPVDLAIVDLGLPEIPGMEIIRRARQAGRNVPILILTARGRWQEKVEGLEAGADDYLVKPFQSEELMARLRALVRRSAGWAQAQLVCDPVRLDPMSQEVFLHDEPIEITKFEYKLLEYLMLHAGEVASKTQLTEHIYAEDDERDSNVIEVFIRRLRTKLDPDGSLNPIETLRGRGYRLRLHRSSFIKAGK